jgi:alpha-L-fucosidase 2
MATQSRRRFLAQVPAAVTFARSLRKQQTDAVPSEWVLWYKQPAKIWTDALPVGNGRLGAMVFGGINEERLQLNEDTLWSGYPRDWNNPHASEALPEIRKFVLEEKRYKDADGACKRMQGPYNQSYQPLGNLRLKFAGLGDVTEYRRELDLDTGIAGVSFTSGGVRYTREVFCSTPDQVTVLRLTAGKKGALNFTAALDSPLRAASEALGKDELRLRGKAPANVAPNYIDAKEAVIYDNAEGKGMRFECALRLQSKGGKVEAENGALRVAGASEVTILLAAGTGYRGFDQMPDRGAEEIAKGCNGEKNFSANKGRSRQRSSDPFQENDARFGQDKCGEPADR